MFSEITGDEGTGPEIDSKLGEAIKEVWQSELSKNKLKRYYEKYKIPSHCLYLKVPMMDSEIYHHISKPSKAHDVKLQEHQKNIVKASTGVVETLKTLIGIKSNEKLSSQTLTELKQKATDFLAMLSKANNYINEMRTDDVFPQLGKDIRQIRFSIFKESKTLFGEDVKKITSVKKMQRDIRTSSSYSSTPHYYKSKKSSYTPYNSSSSTPYNSKEHEELPIKTKQLLWEEKQGPIQQELKVSDTDIKKLHDLAEKVKAGNIKFHLENWKKLTNDKYRLSIVQHGLKFNFN